MGADPDQNEDVILPVVVVKPPPPSTTSEHSAYQRTPTESQSIESQPIESQPDKPSTSEPPTTSEPTTAYEPPTASEPPTKSEPTTKSEQPTTSEPQKKAPVSEHEFCKTMPTNSSATTASCAGSTNHKYDGKPRKPGNTNAPPAPSFSKFSYRASSFFLANAAATGELGTGPIEFNSVDKSLVVAIFQTIPWALLFIVFLWSLLVAGIAYGLGKQTGQHLSTFSTAFWTTRINVPSSITYTLGWALFVLLGFFIREASNRYQEGQHAIHKAACHLRQVIRILRQMYPPGTWHEGDLDRIAAHIVAYPIALKMTLRSERERCQLEQILHPHDVTDALNADVIHIHCSRVVRAYFSASEDDGMHNFSLASKTLAGRATRFFVIDILDAVDLAANTAVRIAEFRSAAVYVNHLRFFLYIWLMFLPLALVQTSGWFTMLWSVLIAYSVSMLFIIARALNEPYGFDAQDVKLNRLCAQYAHDCLIDYTSVKMGLIELLNRDHNTPTWLEELAPDEQTDNDEQEQTGEQTEEIHMEVEEGEDDASFRRNLYRCTIGKLFHLLSKITLRPIRPSVSTAVFFAVVWSTIIIFATWVHAKGDERMPGTRWWFVYIPIDSATTRYVSLAIFLLLAFWVNDAYDRYWYALQIWQSRIRSNVEEVVFQFSMLCTKGMWHERDRERIFSHVVALPYAAKVALRESRDLTDLQGVLCENDIQALAEAPSPDMHILDVIYGYINSADAERDYDASHSGMTPFHAAGYTMLTKLWSIESALNECHAMRRFPLSPAFTAHLLAFTFFWVALLPMVLVLHDGFLSYFYIIPIAYSIVNFVMIGRELTDPFGFDEDDIPLDELCGEMKRAVHRIYHETLDGPAGYIMESNYSRDVFEPRVPGEGEDDVSSEESEDEGGAETASTEPTTLQKVMRFAGIVMRVIYVEVIEVLNLIPFVAIRVPMEGDIENPKITMLKNFGKKSLKVICFPFVKLYALGHGIASVLRSRAEDARNELDEAADEERKKSVLASIIKMFRTLPSVPLTSLILSTAWCIVAVGISYGFSLVWDDDRQERCTRWCSPIDVESSVLANVGFALFLILTLRASDAVDRYEDGAHLISNVEMHLRNLSVEVVQSFRDGCFHQGDKERIVAHLVQLPLCFRDNLLDIVRVKKRDKEGFLTIEDRHRFENSASPIEYLLQTVEAYFLLQDGHHREHLMESPMKNPGSVTVTHLNRIAAVRELIARALAVKRFPVIATYARHQNFFTWLWITLLPLAMTAHTGFVTMALSPVIAYAVLSLESIVEQLVDPYGHDAVDIPVNKMCTQASKAIVDAVNSVKWESQYHTQPSVRDEARLGSAWNEDAFVPTYSLGHVGDDDETDTPDTPDQTDCDSNAILIGGPREPKAKPTLAAHVLRSLPWWVLLCVTVWTAMACLISYAARERRNDGVRWWVSFISISSSTMTYMSFVTFLLLGFFVQASLTRFTAAGNIWGDSLRSSCHTLASLFLSLAPSDAIHEDDHERIIGHLAALPLVLKQELRDSRDIREIHGLLSAADVSRVEVATSMAGHCIDVLRSYAYKVTCREEHVCGHRIKPQRRAAFLMREIMTIEQLVRLCRSFYDFRLAPGFMSLLKALLALWHCFLPFSLTERSGWFTILWVPIVSVAVLGMYQIGLEMQDPFGTDLNDLDMELFADDIVTDVVTVYRKKRTGWRCDVMAIATSDQWAHVTEETTAEARKPLFSERDRLRRKARFLEGLNLGRFAIQRKVMVGSIVWTIISLGVAYAVSKYLPQRGKNVLCRPWFCSAISVDDSLLEYVGVALFLLLGYRLYDSHFRYVQALRIWQDGLIGTIRLFTNRLFESYSSGSWHEGDLERICGHVAAFSISLMGSLRGRDYEARLRLVLGDEDVHRVLRAHSRADHCIDVIRAYLIDGERLEQEEDKVHPCAANEHWALFYYLRKLSDAGVDCQNMMRVPLPFGYVQHLRIFLGIWIMLLPLGLVEKTGWLTILWMIFIVYAIVGMDTWADKLSDPFGLDFTDVPLERLNDRVVAIVKTNLHLFNSGMQSIICSNRTGFVQTDALPFPLSTLSSAPPSHKLMSDHAITMISEEV